MVHRVGLMRATYAKLMQPILYIQDNSPLGCYLQPSFGRHHSTPKLGPSLVALLTFQGYKMLLV